MKPFVLLILSFVLLVPIQAQDNDCTALFEEAVSTTAESCVDLEDNTLCYGYEDVTLFVDCEDFPEFDSTGDLVTLDKVCMMRVSQSLDDAQNGIAIMNVQPEHTAGYATYVLMGDGELHNAASGTFEMNAWMLEDSILRTGPGSSFDQLTTVVAEDQLLVHACNCTQNWMRVMLDSGQIGWLPSRTVNVEGDADELPIIDRDAPFFDKMQAFTLQTTETACTDTPNGLLIQTHNTDRAWLPLQVNLTQILADATLFVRAPLDDDLTIAVLEGEVEVTHNDQIYDLGAGAEIHIPRDNNQEISITVYGEDAVAQLPLNLLPETIDPLAHLGNMDPVIVSIPQCSVLSNSSDDDPCPITFINPDGDAMVKMNVDFVIAPEGEWESSVIDNPTLMEGNTTGGVIAWQPTCSTGPRCFIGPVKWLITLTDENGHTSAPFEASFNCVETK